MKHKGETDTYTEFMKRYLFRLTNLEGMRIKCKYLTRLGIVLLLIICLIFPMAQITVNAANQNPSSAEIAGIFDRVGQEKQIPPVILKAIAYTESGWRQWDSSGNVVTSYWGANPNIGIMQVGTYNPNDTTLVTKLKNDISFNIEYGADILLSKWNATPRIGDGDPNILENWYFAIWAYNGWVTYNNPNNAAAAGRIAYQDKIIKLIGTEYFKGLLNPSKVTPIPAHLIPTGTLPSKNTKWQTPLPIHYGGLGEVAVFSDEDILLLESVNRLAGSDRIETAVKIAMSGWPEGCDTVLIARADDFPDALAGVALAKINNAPILLTSKNQLDPRVEEVLVSLKPQKVILLGGGNALGDEVEKRLREVLNWTEDFQRIAGKDRFETAVLIASEFPADSSVALATGYNFPDALSLASAAGAQGYPLLLVTKDNLPNVTEEYLSKIHPQSLYLAGGEGIVSSKVVERLTQASSVSSEQIKRLAGQNRYDTSVLIIKEFYPTAAKLFLATGQDFPDALAGAALAANQNTPLLLIRPTGPADDSITKDYIKTLPLEVELEVFGGEKAISDKAIIMIKTLLGMI